MGRIQLTGSTSLEYGRRVAAQQQMEMQQHVQDGIRTQQAARSAELFQHLDRNNDGVLDREEFTAGLAHVSPTTLSPYNSEQRFEFFTEFQSRLERMRSPGSKRE